MRVASVFPEEFLDRYRRQKVNWGPLGLPVFLTYYSRTQEDGSKETWVDTCDRVVSGVYDIQRRHCQERDRPFDPLRAHRDARKMFDLLFHFKWSPPGRGLWAMGTHAMWSHGAGVLLNCGFFSTQDRLVDAMTDVMNFSMLGVGCGFDTKGAGKWMVRNPAGREYPHEVEDTRMGWVTSVDALLRAYMYNGPIPVFKYGKIRPAGAPLKTFGGVSSGPDPLIRLHAYLRNLCEAYRNRYVDSAFIVDAMNLIGKCTEAGNIRRSAEIALGEYGDLAFYDLKSDQEKLYSHRYMSNNSVITPVGSDYTGIANRIRRGVDLGVLWLDNARQYGRMNGLQNTSDYGAMGVNPCSEQTLWDQELCNVVETYMARHGSLHEYMRSVKAAFLYAKTVSLMKTGHAKVDAMIDKHRRIGCSQSGIIRAMNKFGRARVFDWSDMTYDFLTGLDADFSCWFDVPRSIKRTTIKPSGTVPLLPGEDGALNYPISEFYYRTMRIDQKHPVLKALDRAGYRIEPNAYGDGSQMVVYFPCRSENFVKSEKQVSMWEQLENAAQMQRWWCDNQVSTTIKFSPDEAKDLETALEMYEHRLKSVTFLPQDEGVYKQAPYQAISKEEYGRALDTIQPIVYHDVNVDAAAPTGCDGDKCELT